MWGSTGSIERILRGPAKLDDGTHNLLGCLKTSMGTLGARTISEMQTVEVGGGSLPAHRRKGVPERLKI
jgi:hypothetical protein